MSEAPGGTPATPAATPEGEQPAGGGYTPPATQEEFDKRIGPRLAREREKYADYDAVKDKAAKWDAHDEANKSEIQKATDAKTAAESERDAAQAELARYKAIAKHSVPEEFQHLVVGNDEAALEAAAESVAKLIAKESEPPKKGAVGPYVPGGQQQPPALNSDALTRGLAAAVGARR